MRAKPKNEPLADRRRLLPQTSGARQAPRYAKDPQNDATALKTKSKPQFDSLRGGLQIEAAPTPAPLLLEGGENDWKYEITPYEPGDCRPVVFLMWRWATRRWGASRSRCTTTRAPGPARTLDVCVRASAAILWKGPEGRRSGTRAPGSTA